MKKFVTSLFAVAIILATPAAVSASQYGQGTYGQGTILTGASDEVVTHQPIETGLVENLGVAGAALIVGAFILRKRSNLVSFN